MEARVAPRIEDSDPRELALRGRLGDRDSVVATLLLGERLEADRPGVGAGGPVGEGGRLRAIRDRDAAAGGHDRWRCCALTPGGAEGRRGAAGGRRERQQERKREAALTQRDGLEAPAARQAQAALEAVLLVLRSGRPATRAVHSRSSAGKAGASAPLPLRRRQSR